MSAALWGRTPVLRPTSTSACSKSVRGGRADLEVCPTSLPSQLLLQVLLVFFLQSRIARAGINIGGSIFPGLYFRLGPLVVDVRLVRLVHHLLHHLRGNEVHALAIAEHDIAGH